MRITARHAEARPLARSRPLVEATGWHNGFDMSEEWAASRARQLSILKVILWNDWDPIGVNGEPGAIDEYDSYAPAILRMLEAGATAEQIGEHLLKIAVERMHVVGDADKAGRHALAVAAGMLETLRGNRRWPGLPEARRAEIPRGKIVDYLLSRTHQQGRHKAAAFMRFGFEPGDWEDLAKALRWHATRHIVETVEETPYGTRYSVDGILISPDERKPTVRSVWFIGRGEEVPRLVTAYFLERREGK